MGLDALDGRDEEASRAIRLSIPREYYLLPGFLATTGATIGLFRGSRTESLRYLAENAHRAPTTVQGWYFYNKTKNYRMILGGLREGGADGLRLGLTGAGWVGMEGAMEWAGLDDAREIGAGIGTAGVFAAIYRLPWIAARKALLLGLVAGTTMRVLRYTKTRLRAEALKELFDVTPFSCSTECLGLLDHKPPSSSSSSSSSSSTMLRLWGPSTPHDQTTPKASAVERNPFESAQPTDSAAESPRTPSSLHHHLLNTTTPNGPLTPLDIGALTPAAANNFAAVAAKIPTTSLSLKPPVFKMKQPPLPRNAGNNNNSQTPTPTQTPAPTPTPVAPSPASSPVPSNTSAKGQLHVKLIQARNLNVQSAQARPYVVVQFEQNEFVSREPTLESEKEVKGVATNMSRNGSSTALSALGAISIGKAFDAAARARSAITPSSSFSSARSSITVRNGTGTPTGPPSSSGTASPGVFGGLSAHNPVWKHEVSFDVTSDQSMITLNVYDRTHDTEHSFLGTLQVKPVLVHDHTVDQWYKLRPFENEVVTGEIRVQVTYEQLQTKRSLTPRDFEFLKLIGRGTFGRVFQVRKKDTKRIYAMKVLSKKEIVAKKEVAHTIGERKILQQSLDSPFLVGLKFSFQTDSELYLVTDFKSGGELFWHLQRETRFHEDRARFYIAELILALEHLHKYDIVYRDLKPENILLDATGHVALCDFGLSKPDLPADQLTNTFCGTTEYLAPEVLLDDHGYSKLVDFWSLGVLLFEMCCGWSPFYAEDTQQMYKNICFGKIRFPKGVIGEDGKLFVKGLLNRNPKHRLGAINDAAELKAHPFFKNIDWPALSLKQVTPPFRPDVESDESTTNFDPEFTTADLREHGIEDDPDEDDPSEHWVASASVSAAPGVYMPNGPLGSDHANGSTNGHTKAVAIEKRRKKRTVAAGSPLTNSVQENFRGFTFSGESSLHQASWLAGRAKEEEVADVEAEDDGPDPDDVDDDAAYAGRYARRRDMDVDAEFA